MRTSPLASEIELIQTALKGSRQSYDELVKLWSARVYSYVRSRVRHDHIAEEITQDAFVKAYCRLDKLRERDRFGPWLLTIAHRLILDWAQKKERGETNLEPAHAELLRQPSDEDSDDSQLSNLRRSVDELPETLREAIYTYYFEKMTYQDVADILGVSVGTINARLAKARALLRKRMLVHQGELN